MSCIDLSKSFLQLQLPAYSIAQNISTETEEIGIGYAHPWQYVTRKHPEWKISDPTVLVIVISILVLSKLIIITLVITYYESVKEFMKGKTSPGVSLHNILGPCYW